GRLSEVLLRLEAVVDKVVTLSEDRQLVLAVFIASPDFVEAVERQDRTVGAEDVITTLDLDLGLVVHGRGHAAGYEPEPDEVVELVLVRGEVSADRLRGPADIGWPDRFVRI